MFVGSISPDVPEEMLRQLFDQRHLRVVKLTIKRDRYGIPKGHAFVALEHPDCVEAALQLHGVWLCGRSLVVLRKRTNVVGMRSMRAPFAARSSLPPQTEMLDGAPQRSVE